MRVERKQAKIFTEVAIPVRLLEFFQDVNHLIEQRDDSTTIESDDLIQAEFACGGLIDEGSDHFGFTYFPAKEDTRHTWTFELTASEIADISQGKKKTLVLWGCQNPKCGSLFSSENDACFDCDYVDDERDEKDIVLNSLSQSLTREDWVRNYLTNYPNANPFEIIGDYNSTRLGERWGTFR